jgi:NAD(P)-dependent dehydrogenase (short-subunit alcohol dehydrogenase family)
LNTNPSRSAIVTGAAGGLGTEICTQLLAAGWDVLAGWHSRNDVFGVLESAAKEHGRTIVPVRLDMNDAGALAEGIDRDMPSPVEALIINAARPPSIAPLAATESSELRAQFETSAVGPLELIRAVWRRHFQKRRKGHIIAVSTSALDNPGSPPMAAYVAGKAALEVIVTCAAAEYSAGGLVATIIRPSYIDTGMLHAFEPRVVEILRARDLVRKPGDVASMVVSAAMNPPRATVLVRV